VFVTGSSNGATSNADYVTVAYQAATGARLWASRYNGPGNGYDAAASVAVSPRGGRVFVTGYSNGAAGTVAYSAATGARLWARRYNGHQGAAATSVAVSPTGKTVFVTGYSNGAGREYATVAYSAATGARLWAERYNGHGSGYDAAASLAVGPGGRTVFVTGSSTGATSGPDYATVAYNAATGARLWARRYNGPGNSDDAAASVAVGPGGRTVFVTGSSTGATSHADWATVAYQAATGTRLWARRYNSPGNSDDSAAAVAVSPTRGEVFVTGNSQLGASRTAEYVTVTYSAVTGARLWTRRYHSNGDGEDGAASVAVSPGGRTVFVTGSSAGVTTSYDYATIAYSG
jgi:WD40 repeat protein